MVEAIKNLFSEDGDKIQAIADIFRMILDYVFDSYISK